MPERIRPERVANEAHAAIADVLRTRLKDPRVTPISITHVDVSSDLRAIRIHFVPLGGQGDPRSIQAGLEAAKGFLRRHVGERLGMRRVPDLVFVHDAGLDQSIRVTSLIEGISPPKGDDPKDDEPETS